MRINKGERLCINVKTTAMNMKHIGKTDSVSHSAAKLFFRAALSYPLKAHRQFFLGVSPPGDKEVKA